jgi:hypothetical protein
MQVRFGLRFGFSSDTLVDEAIATQIGSLCELVAVIVPVHADLPTAA